MFNEISNSRLSLCFLAGMAIIATIISKPFSLFSPAVKDEKPAENFDFDFSFDFDDYVSSRNAE